MGRIKTLFHRVFTPQFIRFIMVAALNTAVGWCIYALLLMLFKHLQVKNPFIPASFFGTILSVLFNFKTYGNIVFRNKNNRLIFKFIGVYCITYLCNIGGIALLERWGIGNYLAGALTAIPVGFLGYFLNKFFVYKKKPAKVIQDWEEQKDNFSPYEILGEEPEDAESGRKGGPGSDRPAGPAV